MEISFYILDRNLFERGKFAYTEHFSNEFNVGEPERCPVCGKAVSMLELLEPIRIKLSNRFLADIIFGEIAPFIVSENFKKAYIDSGLTGITRFRPVEIQKIKGVKEKPSISYYLPVVGRSDARIDEIQSHFVRKGNINCFECKSGTIIQSFDSLRLIPNTWSGEDVFYAKWLASTVFVSDKFIQFANDHKFTNVGVTKAVEYRSRF